MTPLPQAMPTCTPTTAGITLLVTSCTFFCNALISSRLAGTLVRGVLSARARVPPVSRRAVISDAASRLRFVIDSLRGSRSRGGVEGRIVYQQYTPFIGDRDAANCVFWEEFFQILPAFGKAGQVRERPALPVLTE